MDYNGLGLQDKDYNTKDKYKWIIAFIIFIYLTI